MSSKRLDPQEQHDIVPGARARPADTAADTARTENRMSHAHVRKHRSTRQLDTRTRSAASPLRSSPKRRRVVVLLALGRFAGVIVRVGRTRRIEPERPLLHLIAGAFPSAPAPYV